MSEERETGRRRSFFTIPNVLSGIRILGAPGLVILGGTGRGDPFLALFLFLMATDWIDGKLAIWLDQRSSLGARIDSAADVVMYGSLLVG
ncbi:MAG: CDP-alcohol phosphatidyltransferase family protein, partial [Gemmatimonadetes bacterium]|nr:CDP-alcohol phosphatidyltransferase family protein [Gemmatimonadota bacterium]NIR78317.1 CDP-alcohol phosphatidyltransferase family protein [Gemmatimonadota bacterium]NIT87905.1 CDP-alcohol phosphatidyltransferase family protein [Gemmatimonadota bacterium]NIU31759.1 CDP-alcohol phosphatidyltransferase family protein [Gemmatimonadota bacterium]NIU35558.1 CDP-alcohol phosphatidyltransferase family protein [Gemmatimonadota bacterium]